MAERRDLGTLLDPDADAVAGEGGGEVADVAEGGSKGVPRVRKRGRRLLVGDAGAGASLAAVDKRDRTTGDSSAPGEVESLKQWSCPGRPH